MNAILRGLGKNADVLQPGLQSIKKDSPVGKCKSENLCNQLLSDWRVID